MLDADFICVAATRYADDAPDFDAALLVFFF